MAVGRGLFGLGSAVEDLTSPWRLPNTLGEGRKPCGTPRTVVAVEEDGEDEAPRPVSGTRRWLAAVAPGSGTPFTPAPADELTVGPLKQAVAPCDGGEQRLLP